MNMAADDGKTTVADPHIHRVSMFCNLHLQRIVGTVLQSHSAQCDHCSQKFLSFYVNIFIINYSKSQFLLKSISKFNSNLTENTHYIFALKINQLIRYRRRGTQFTERTILNAQVHFVGRMQRFIMFKRVVYT
jgi:hypothetical protein